MKFSSPAPSLTIAIAITLFTSVAHPQNANAPQTAAPADDAAPSGGTWRLYASPDTWHYSYDSAHRHVLAIGLERQRADGWLLGGSAFRNSFGQPSAYAYLGKRFNNFSAYEPLFAELTGGVLYGYKAPYNHKVPFNYKGWSPGVVPSVGWQFTPTYSAQLNFLGTSALMLQFSADFQ